MKTLASGMRLLGGLTSLVLACTAAAQTQQGVSKNEIVIGTVLDLSGPIAYNGKQTLGGMQLRVDEVNAAGGIHGRKIKLIVDDNGYDPKRSVLATQKQVNNDKIFAMVAHMGTAPTVAAMPILFENNVINFTPLSGARQMFEPADRLKVAMILPYYEDIELGVKYLVKKKNHTKVCMIYQDDEFGLEQVRGAEDALKSMNMSLVERSSFKRGSTDFASQVARVKGAGCTMVALGALVRETVGIMTEAQKLDFKPDFIGASAVYNNTMQQLGGKTVEGLYGVSAIETASPDSKSKRTRDWYAAYKAKHNEDPQSISGWGYTMVDLFVQAATKAGPNLTTDSLINALESNTFPLYFGGDFKISKTNRLGIDKEAIYQIQNGKWIQLTDPIAVR